MAVLKTYIVEDSPVIRENLIATLEELVPVDVVGTAEDESTAAYWLTRESSDCDLLIVDIFLKSGSGLGVLKVAQDLESSMKTVVLSNYATTDCATAGSAIHRARATLKYKVKYKVLRITRFWQSARGPGPPCRKRLTVGRGVTGLRCTANCGTMKGLPK